MAPVSQPPNKAAGGKESGCKIRKSKGKEHKEPEGLQAPRNQRTRLVPGLTEVKVGPQQNHRIRGRHPCTNPSPRTASHGGCRMSSPGGPAEGAAGPWTGHTFMLGLPQPLPCFTQEACGLSPPRAQAAAPLHLPPQQAADGENRGGYR